MQNAQIINRRNSQSLSPFLNHSNILKGLFLKITGELTRQRSDVTFVNELNEDGFTITRGIEHPNFTNSYTGAINFSKTFLRSFHGKLSYSFRYSENDLFFNNQFVEAINRRHALNFKLDYDNGGWFAFAYNTQFNAGASQVSNNRTNNTFFFQTADLNFYTSSSTRLNLSLESVQTKTSFSNTINKNTLSNIGFYYNPSKKIYLKASLLNIFNTSFFSTTNSTSNFVSLSQFSLRPRQFTIGITYSL